MKLTAVTITFRGKTVTEFHMLPVVNGKAVCPPSVIDGILIPLGVERGMTYTLG